MYYFTNIGNDKRGIICIDPTKVHPNLEKDIIEGRLFTISNLFYPIFMSSINNKTLYIKIHKNETYEKILNKLDIYLKKLINNEIKYWYNKTNWYMLMEKDNLILDFYFISSFSNDIFQIEFIKNNDDISLNITMKSGYLNNFIYFVNHLEKELNEDRFNKEGFLLEKQNDKYENNLWRDFFSIPIDDKFNIAIIYMNMLNLYDKLLGIFFLNMLIQYKIEYVFDKLVSHKENILCILNLLKIPFLDGLSLQLIERTLFALNLLSKNKVIYNVIMEDQLNVKFFKKISNDNNVHRELVIIKNECINLLNKNKKYK